MLFTLLWSLAVIRVLLSPVRHTLRPVFRVLFLCLIVWALIGMTRFAYLYSHYRGQRLERAEEIATLTAILQQYQTVEATHPTAREVLFGLAELNYRLGNKIALERVLEKIAQVDPNDPRASEYRQSP